MAMAQSVQPCQDELRRYGRQMILSAIGRNGQDQINQTKVLLIGVGGIGSSVAMYLASSGIGLTIIDHDLVDVSNLHRYI
jgi:molybdopterin/thiamine biosynthesis adenylyltransferase